MTSPQRRILVTGAAGYIGRALTTALTADPANASAKIILLDCQFVTPPGVPCEDPQIEIVAGDLADPATIDAAIGEGIDLAYHLAAVVGGAAEADYELARRINIDATLTLFERLRACGRLTRVVNASSIAVFGEPPPPFVNDQTIPRPMMTYGAQKHMIEIALAQFSMRGWLDGISLRLPAIVAKPAVPGITPVFLNRVFHAFAAGEDMEMPVSPDGTSWLLSLDACIVALLHAGHIPSEAIGACRSVTLPALRVSMRKLVEALARRYPGSNTRVDYAPNPSIQAQFASQPPLATPAAARLGFRHDGDVDLLIRGAVV